MRTHLVVLTPELLDQDLRIDSVFEPLHAETLIAELAVERLVGAVLPGFAGIDEGSVDVLVCEPAQDGARNELRAVVHIEA